jgi:hypothetical protein
LTNLINYDKLLSLLKFFVFFLFISNICGAATLELFNSGTQTPNYTKLVESIRAGDTLVFSGGTRFDVTEVLGNGMTTKIVAIGDGKALRIPLASGIFDDFGRKTPYTKFIDFFLDGYVKLRERDGPVVETFVEESRRGEFAVVRHEKVRFFYHDFLANKVALSAEDRAKAEADLVEFARKTWGFIIVGDQFEEQVRSRLGFFRSRGE